METLGADFWVAFATLGLCAVCPVMVILTTCYHLGGALEKCLPPPAFFSKSAPRPSWQPLGWGMAMVVASFVATGCLYHVSKTPAGSDPRLSALAGLAITMSAVALLFGVMILERIYERLAAAAPATAA